MSKYTTELRFICEELTGYDESQSYSQTNQIIQKSAPLIFDFSYPIYDNSYKSVLEEKIIRHYYTREICSETYGRWKMFLEEKMNLIMPYYNQLYKSTLLEFNPFYDVDLTTDSNRKINHDENTTAKSNTENDNTSSSKSTDAYSDTPQGSLQNVENMTYLTNARIVNDNSQSKDTGNYNGSGTRLYDNTDDYLEHVIGKRGGQSYSELLNQYRDTFLNIDRDIINDLSDLFFNLW